MTATIVSAAGEPGAARDARDGSSPVYVFVIGREVDVRLVSLRSGGGGSDKRGEGDALTGISFDEDELASSVSSLSLTAL